MDYYEVLGITATASLEDIQGAYRRAAMRWHPEKNQGDQEAEEKFRELAQAYAVLSTPDSRKQYDDQVKQGQPSDSTQPSTVDSETAAAIFLQEMDDLAGELRAHGVAQQSIAESLVKRGCPESVARQVAEGKGAGRRMATVVAKGAQPKPEPAKRPPRAEKLPPAPFKERRWALLAHGLLIVVSLPFLLTTAAVSVPPVLASFLPVPIIVSYVMYLRNRKANEWLAFHGLQAALFQLVVVGVTFFYGPAILMMG
ncbi:MAG: DnaJ domain-containing protein, partial [Chloroflexota bacterium]|nr:DnaJ domain-containing protein [Chloroflexota bacterium]